MNDLSDLGIVTLEIDENGMVSVVCPKCNSEFKIPSKSMNNDEIVICPHCKSELLDVYFSERDSDRIINKATESAMEYATDELNRSINKINRQLK